MPRPKNPVPSYSLHRPSGQARARVNGRDVYLGPYGSPASLAAYERVFAAARTAAAGTAIPVPAPRPPDPTVNEVLAAFLDHVVDPKL